MNIERYSLKNDYSEGAHLRILDALLQSNMKQEHGYGEDSICQEARSILQSHIQNLEADIHFVSGGTQANILSISSFLRPYEAIISAESGHIAANEVGAIESTGHKVCTISTETGKLTASLIDKVCKSHADVTMVQPRLVYISNSTELGSVYTKAELQEISEYCKKSNLYFYIDGARLGSALVSHKNDMSISEFASFPDIFYIGATKNGGLLGEAIVINNKELMKNFRYNIKQKGALLSKGRILGIQFRELFRDDLFFELANHANNMAQKISKAVSELGYMFYVETASNQLFFILPNTTIEFLQKKYDFFVWSEYDSDHSVIRIVTSWATLESKVEEFILDLTHS